MGLLILGCIAGVRRQEDDRFSMILIWITPSICEENKIETAGIFLIYSGVNMQVEHHPLAVDFPEFKEQIHLLKANDAHFAKLFDEYGNTDKAVNRAENGVEHLSDAALEALKKVRIHLKDQLFQLLQATTKA
ncbi:YdcH family protein [Undibacterium sp. SXout20W]|uniref:YdcH family protein n=1 Tax=Undibacterium sp. SXout20W TaxID=3413051 RepID=UPI003BF4461F